MTALRGPDQSQTDGSASEQPPPSPERVLAPRRDREATLSALVDSLLNQGVYLNLDAVITVAGVPLIGLSLRAALAGMETFVQYGMFADWDRRDQERGPAAPARAAPRSEQAHPEPPARAGELWLEETRASGRVWRRGSGVWDRGGFRWTGDGDRRAAVRIAPEDILSVGSEAEEAAEGRPAPEGLRAFELVSRAGTLRLAAAAGTDWPDRLRRAPEGEDDGGYAQD